MKKRDFKLQINTCIAKTHLTYGQHKMVKHTQTIHRQIANKLFECFTSLLGRRLKG